MTQASKLAVVVGLLSAAGCATHSPPARSPAAPGASAKAPSGTNPSTVTLSTTSELPRPNTQPDAVVAVQIKADGSVYIDAKRIAGPDAVASTIDAAHPGDHSKLQALIYADGDARYGNVVPVLDALRRDGVTRIGIVVRPPDKKKASASATSSPSPEASASSAAPAKGAPPAPSPSAAAAQDEPPGKLPEVTVENLGLHIGGGPNDDAHKAPYKKAIAPHFDDFRACYAKVEEPEKGGTFGVDLHLGRNGGKPDVRQPRTGMEGKAFRDCVIGVFKNIEFPPPHKPVVFSYSLRFKVGK